MRATPEAEKAYADALEKMQSLITELQAAHDELRDNENINWARIGSMGHSNELLDEAAEVWRSVGIRTA